MDNETRAALELTKEDLVAMRARGAPDRVATRPRDLNQLASSIVDEAVDESEHSTIIHVGSFSGIHIDPFRRPAELVFADNSAVRVG